MSQWRNSLTGRGKVTRALIGINVLVYLAQMAAGVPGDIEENNVTQLLALNTGAVFEQPWTIITSGFAHADPIHILLNMYSLWIFGEAIESYLGTKKFLGLYLASILGGSIATIIFSTGSVVGASGGIFGLMGAYFIIIRALGFRSSQMLVLIAINVAMGFFYGGIAIAAHLGGLATGAALAWYYTKLKK